MSAPLPIIERVQCDALLTRTELDFIDAEAELRMVTREELLAMLLVDGIREARRDRETLKRVKATVEEMADAADAMADAPEGAIDHEGGTD